MKTILRAAIYTALLTQGCVCFSADISQASSDPRANAPIDVTGYWVSVVTEDWRFRMLVADPGETESVPLNALGKAAAKLWTPTRDVSDPDEACRAFGAGGIMRIPGRLHITWSDSHTLRIDTDAGSQTRILNFGQDTPAQPPSWQGQSSATWEAVPASSGPLGKPMKTPKEGYLRVATSNLRPGYLRTNGVPYSGAAQLQEFFDTFEEANGDRWLVVTSVVTDPTYLTEPFVTSSHFKHLADKSGWDPTPCRPNVPR